jgi:glycosyltransferase involved in cell wall biosynthesis
MSLSILFVHQGYELYGSDRTFIQSVQAAASRWPEARITVLLPCDGILRTALLSIVEDVRIADLGILRKSNLKKMRLRDARGFVGKIWEARRMMRDYDITYINTVTVIDYILAASVVRRPRILHVHEIPTGLAAHFFAGLIVLSRAFLIFNSQATRRSFTVPVWQRCAVVWNGVAPAPGLPAATPHFGMNLLLIGRFNSWKGQAVLLRAVAQLPPDLRIQVRVRLVGGVFEDQQHFADELVRLVKDLELSEIVAMLPFTPNPYEHYAWADIVVVPSTKPEPFGLVAIEGMAAGCSIIASNHGGIREIVLDGVTGSLVVPGSIGSLAASIVRYIEDPTRARGEGRAGRQRFAAEFEESHYKLKITNIISDLVKASAP